MDFVEPTSSVHLGFERQGSQQSSASQRDQRIPSMAAMAHGELLGSVGCEPSRNSKMALKGGSRSPCHRYTQVREIALMESTSVAWLSKLRLKQAMWRKVRMENE